MSLDGCASLVFGFEMFRAKVFGAHVETTTTTKTIGVLVGNSFVERQASPPCASP